VLDNEVFGVAERLNASGIIVFVLLCRLPGEGHSDGANTPPQDPKWAMRLVRSRAAEFSLDPAHIGVVGLSAGGYLSDSLATRFDSRVYLPRDAIDLLLARPDCAALIYPVTLMQGDVVHRLSRPQWLGQERPVEEEVALFGIAPAVRSEQLPVSLLHALDGTAVPRAISVCVFEVCPALDRPLEHHLFAQGGHGFGLRHARGLPMDRWPDLLLAWIEWQGLQSGAGLDVGDGGE
jgi:acetyl esterase/lipase